MKIKSRLGWALGALLPFLVTAPAFGVVTIQPLATTTTTDTGVSTAGRKYVLVMVYSTTGSGTSTVVLEEQSDGTTGTSAPWITVKTMTNCDADGLDNASVPCSYSTLTPRARTRLRVSACSSCSLQRIIQDVQ